MLVSERTYQCIALEDPNAKWELHRGRLREKPAMTWDHDVVSFRLGHRLQLQLSEDQFQVLVNGGRLRRTARNYSIPDVMVVPVELAVHLRGRRDRLAYFKDPLPLVAEVWSPSTGVYDTDSKLPEYPRRGDREIWRLHPYERTLVAWRRRPDGTYAETLYRGGIVRSVALPNVAIDLDALFDV